MQRDLPVMIDDKPPEKSLDDLFAEFAVLMKHADEVRQQLKELTLQIEARGSKSLLYGWTRPFVAIPQPPAQPIQDQATQADAVQSDLNLGSESTAKQ